MAETLGRTLGHLPLHGGWILEAITCGSSVPLVVSLFRITSDTPASTRSGLAVIYMSHVLQRGARAGCLERWALHCSLAFIIINNGEASELGT